MTTIAYDRDEGIIASDSQETEGSGMKTTCKKLYRVGKVIIGTAGGSYSGLVFVRWMESQRDPENPNWEDTPDLSNLSEDEDFECLVVRSDGSFYTVNKLFTPYEREESTAIALGSGAKIAIGALMAGSTVRKAVKCATKVDAFSGGRVQWYKVK